MLFEVKMCNVQRPLLLLILINVFKFDCEHPNQKKRLRNKFKQREIGGRRTETILILTLTFFLNIEIVEILNVYPKDRTDFFSLNKNTLK